MQDLSPAGVTRKVGEGFNHVGALHLDAVDLLRVSISSRARPLKTSPSSSQLNWTCLRFATPRKKVFGLQLSKYGEGENYLLPLVPPFFSVFDTYLFPLGLPPLCGG